MDKGAMGMPDRAQVIKGLECCSKGAVEPYVPTIRKCANCPYNQPKIPCTRLLAADALALLEAQQPRVMTLEETKKTDYVWYESRTGFVFPASVRVSLNTLDGYYTVDVWKIWHSEPEWMPEKEYGKTWRCWTARPTPEQREAMKWNE